jgi:hypothetical protein
MGKIVYRWDHYLLLAKRGLYIQRERTLVGKAGAYQRTQLGSQPCPQVLTDSGKHSSLLEYFKNTALKRYYSTGSQWFPSWACLIKLFYSRQLCHSSSVHYQALPPHWPQTLDTDRSVFTVKNALAYRTKWLNYSCKNGLQCGFHRRMETKEFCFGPQTDDLRVAFKHPKPCILCL